MASTSLPLLAIGFGIGFTAGLVVLMDNSARTTPFGTATADLARVAPVTIPPSHASDDKRTLRRSPDGLFYTEVLVGGQPVRFVVDTGASVTVLSPEDAARIGARIDSSIPLDDMETAGGSAEIQWSKRTDISVAGHTVADVQLVLPTAKIRTSLLGQDVLSHLDSLILRGNSLTLD